MRKSIAVAGVALLALAFSSAPAVGQANVAGRWTIAIEGPQGAAEAIAVLAQDGGTFTGTITIDQAGSEGASITDGKVEGNTLTFVLLVEVQGASFPIQVTGTVDGNAMTGQMAVPELGAFPFTAQRGDN